MNEVIESEISAKEKNVTDMDLLIFAKWILSVIVILFFMSSITELLYKGNMVFEICKTMLPSFATLIIGYYFGKE